MALFSYGVLKVTPLKCISMNNQEFKIRTKTINISNNEPLFYPYSNEVNKCGGSWNNIKIIHIQNYVFLMLLKHKCQSIHSNFKN